MSGRPGTPEGTATGADQAALAARIREREPAAIEEVVHAYLPQILRAALGAGLDQPLAEDVTQSTFATFIESAHRFEGRSHVRTWLFGILYNKISEMRREVPKDQRFDDIDDLVGQRLQENGHWSKPHGPAPDTSG